MMNDLFEKMNTLENWDVIAEQKKADFLEHLYQVYKPGNNCYTGLWQRFCLEEAGPFCREKWFDMKKAVELYESGQLQPELML